MGIGEWRTEGVHRREESRAFHHSLGVELNRGKAAADGLLPTWDWSLRVEGGVKSCRFPSLEDCAFPGCLLELGAAIKQCMRGGCFGGRSV